MPPHNPVSAADKVRNLSGARSAYQALDRDELISSHTIPSAADDDAMFSEEAHSENGDLIKSVVYGGVDGILTTFAIISGASGGQLSPKVVLILGISNIIADAVGMGVGDALSSIAHQEHVLSEFSREEKNLQVARPVVIKSLVDTYVEKGLPRDKAMVVVHTIAKYDDILLELLMLEKLQLQLPEDDESPWKDGFITFLSFVVFGFIPLFMYSVAPLLDPDCGENGMFKIACISTGIVLFLLGVTTSCLKNPKTNEFKSWKSYLSPCIIDSISTQSKSSCRTGFEFLFLGGGVAFVAYFIGSFVAYIGHTFLYKYIHEVPDHFGSSHAHLQKQL